MEEKKRSIRTIILLAIVAALLLLALFLSGCCQLLGVGCAVTQYPISGTVTLQQECQPNDPAQISINLTLYRGNQEVGTTVTVPLVGGVGNYNTSVPWAGAQPPTGWKRVTSNDVCKPLGCVDPSMECMDFATDTPTFPIGNPTVKDVRFSCACN